MVSTLAPQVSRSARPQNAGVARPYRPPVMPDGPVSAPAPPSARTRTFRPPQGPASAAERNSTPGASQAVRSPRPSTDLPPSRCPDRAESSTPRNAHPAARGFVAGKKAFSGRGKRPPQQAFPELILFQTFFKSVGPRTYAVQIKQAKNGNRALILIEGKRDPESNEIKKHKVYLWSEDFKAFFAMLGDTAAWMRENPLPEKIKARRESFWKKDSAKPSGQRASGT